MTHKFLFRLLSFVKNSICGRSISEDHPIDSDPIIQLCAVIFVRVYLLLIPNFISRRYRRFSPGRDDGYDWIHRIGLPLVHLHVSQPDIKLVDYSVWPVYGPCGRWPSEQKEGATPSSTITVPGERLIT